MSIFSRFAGWFGRLFRRRPPLPPRRVVFVEGDELPETLPTHDLVVARDDGVYWSAGMMCPCGCGRRLEVMLLDEVKPRWDLIVGEDDRATLSPSIWVKDGCRSHFWLRNGAIIWCSS